MSTRLSPLDATFLELEQADESAHMHIGAIMVFEPTPEGRPPTGEELAEHLSTRLSALPRYSERLSDPHTGGLSWPRWEPDPAFDLLAHLTRAALPQPGGERELAAWASEFFAKRLDRRRPLWEMAIIEGLEGGRWALAHKTHHCLVDGVGSVDVAYVLLDTSPDGANPLLATSAPEPKREAAEMPGAHSPRLRAEALGLDTAVNLTRAGLHGMTHPLDTLGAARAAVELVVREELRGAPHTSLNEPIGSSRRFEVLRVPLEDLKTIKNALGGTVNDAVLAITASGLRALLEARGEELPPAGLRAMVPMNTRPIDEHFALGNRISSLFIDLPVAEPDLLGRHHETVERSRSLKDARQARGSTAMLDAAGLAPPVLHASLARSLYATRLFNLTITNVPGAPQTLYAFGAPMREVHPLVPLAAEHAIGVAAVSYDGNVFFGIVADPGRVPDLDVAVDAMRAALDQLLSAARATARPGRSRAQPARGAAHTAARSRY